MIYDLLCYDIYNKKPNKDAYFKYQHVNLKFVLATYKLLLQVYMVNMEFRCHQYGAYIISPNALNTRFTGDNWAV